MYKARKSSVTSIESRKKRKGRGKAIAPIVDSSSSTSQDILSSSWSNHKQYRNSMSKLDDKTDSIGPVSCSFQDSSLLRMDSVHGNIIISKSSSEHTLGVSPSKPIVVGSLSHSESSPFKEVIPHSILQKQLSKDSIYSSASTADSKQKIDLEKEAELSVVDVPCATFNETESTLLDLDLSSNKQEFENLDRVDDDLDDNEPNNPNELLSSNELSLESSSTTGELSCLNNNSDDLNNHNSVTDDSTISRGNDPSDDDLLDQIIDEKTIKNNTDFILDNQESSNEDNSNADSSTHTRNAQDDIDDTSVMSNNSHSQSEVSVKSAQEKDTNYDVLPSPDDYLIKEENNIIETEKRQQGVGGSQQMVDVLKLGTSVSSANDFFIPGIHASPPPEPEPEQLTDTEVHFMAQNTNLKVKTNSLPQEERLSGVLGTSFESSSNFSDSGSDCYSGSDCFSEQSFSLLADLGITDDFIGIKEDHFSTDV